MAEYLDIAQPIIEIDPDTKEFKATPYFEDYLFNIIQGLGGEGSTVISEVVSSGVQADKVPYLFGLVYTLSNKVTALESQLGNHYIKAMVEQLQIDTAKFNTKVKNTNYTAKNREYIEANGNVTIKLPENAVSGDEVMVANGDGTRIRVDGNGNKIKYTTEADIFNIVRVGSSKHFHFFKDNPNNAGYWRVR